MPEDVANVHMPESVSSESLPEGEEGDVKLFGGEVLDEEPTTATEEPVGEETERPEVNEPSGEGEEEEDKIEEVDKPRPSIKEVTDKYPNLFKDFPDLRHAFFREKEFSNLFEDVEEAKEAAEQAKDFQYFRGKITSGDAKTFLETLKDDGREGLEAFSNSFLSALQEVDNRTFLQVTAPLLQNWLTSAYREGNNAGNNDLKYSAAHLSKYTFGDPRYASGEMQIPPYKKVEQPVDKEREEFEQERRDFQQSRYQNAHESVNESAVDAVKELISEGLQDDENLTDFVRGHVVDDTWRQVDRMLGNDRDHLKYMNRLWENANRRGFDRQSLERIVDVYVGRAKELMPEVRKQVKAKAMGKKITPMRENNKGHVEVTGESRSGGGKKSRPTSAGEVDWRRTSDEDLFSGKVTYKNG